MSVIALIKVKECAYLARIASGSLYVSMPVETLKDARITRLLGCFIASLDHRHLRLLVQSALNDDDEGQQQPRTTF